jgi:DNA polymerase III alpha subunit
MLSYEKDLIGFYITSTPWLLSKTSHGVATADTESLRQMERQGNRFLCGIVSAIKELKTKRKDTMHM